MESFIDSLGFKSLDKVYLAVKEKYPNVSKSEVKKYLDSFGNDFKETLNNKKEIVKRMGKSYSNL